MNELTIPRYTKDDYLLTSEPYDFLYEFRDDSFQLAQIREKMKAQAAECGIKGFIGLWNAYLESRKQRDGVPLEKATAFENQELELMSGRYCCDENGVRFSDRYGYEVEVCRHPILPIQRLVNIDSGEERLRLAYKKGKSWRYIIAEKSTLASASKILELSASGIMVNSENAKLLSSYIFELEQLNYDIIPEEKSVGRLGWVGDHGFSPYVEGLVFDGEQSFRHMFGAVRSEGSFDEWTSIMRKVRASGTSGKLFLAASFASVILEPCGLLPFFLHAWGGTETGKTVGLMVAASVWASPKIGEYISTFNATSVAQELQASFLNSLPMCIDELQIQASSGATDFDRIIYKLTEGAGKLRGEKTGGLQRLTKWKNCIITNGEHPISSINSGGGAKNRILEFECTEKVYTDLVGLCGIITRNFGFAGRIFVDWLKQDGNFERINAVQKRWYQEVLNADTTDKQAASASALLAADEIATELIFKDGNALTLSELEKILTSKGEVNVHKRALDFLFDWIAANPNRFSPNEFGDYQGEVWGSSDIDCVYIIKSVFEKVMRDNGYNAAAFLSWAKRTGKTVCEPNRTTWRKQFKGMNQRIPCVCLKTQDDDMTKEILDEPF